MTADGIPEGLKPSGVTLKTQLRQTEDRNRVLAMVRGGATAEQVSEALAKATPPLHISPGQVRSLVKKHLQRVHMEDSRTIDELRVLENEKLDNLERKLNGLLGSVERGEKQGDPLKVIDRLEKLYERRARLNGLDAPMKVEHSGGVEVMRELGLDEDFIEKSAQAFVTAFAEHAQLPDPATRPVDTTAIEVTDALAQLER